MARIASIFTLIALSAWTGSALAQTGSGLVLPEPPPDTAPVAPTSKENGEPPPQPLAKDAPVTVRADAKPAVAPQAPTEPQPEVPLPPPASVENLPAVPVAPPPPRSSIEVALPTHGCLDSGDTTVQLLQVLYENFADQPGAVNVTSAGFPTLRRGGTYVFPERDSTQVMQSREFVAHPGGYTKEVLAQHLPVLVNVQEIAFQYPYDPRFDALKGIESRLAPGERFPSTARRYGRLTRYKNEQASLLVLELESNEPSTITNDITDYTPEFSGITSISTDDYKTSFYVLGRQIGRISRVWADTEPDRTRAKNPAMLVSLGDVLSSRMPADILDHCGGTAHDLGYTAMVPVASELGLGPEKLVDLAQRYQLPLVAANLFRRESVVNDFTARPFPRFILQERDGLTVAFIGVVDPSELDTLPTSVRDAWRFEDMSIAVGRVIEELRQYLHRRPDLTVVLAASHDPSALTRIEGVDMVIGPPVNSNIDPMRRVTEVPETPSDLEVAYGDGAMILSQPPWRAVTRITAELVRSRGARRARPVRIVEERTPVLEEGPEDAEVEKDFRVVEEKTLIDNARILVPNARTVLDEEPDLADLVWGDHILHRRGYRRMTRDQPARYSDPLWMRFITDMMTTELKSDIALSYNVPREWDIIGPISRDTVSSWLRTGDSVVVVTMTGLELTPIVQRLARQQKSENWPASQMLFAAGIDPVGGVIRGRAIDPREPYRVAITESVLTSRDFADLFAEKKLPPQADRPLLRKLALDALEHHDEGPDGAVHYIEEEVKDKTQMVVPRWKLLVNQLSLSASSYTNSNNLPKFQETRESRVTQQASTQYNIAANISGVYDSARIAWENNVTLQYAKLIARNDTNFNGIPDQRISQETADDLVFTSELRWNALQYQVRKSALRIVPFFQGAYDTEFTPTPGHRRQELGRFISGLVFYPGPRLRELRAGFLIVEDFSAPSPADTNYGLYFGYRIIAPIYQTMRIESSLDLRYEFADAHELPSDMGMYMRDLTRVLWPFFQQRLSLFVSADIVVVRGKATNFDVTNSDGSVTHFASNKTFGGSWILSVGLDFAGVFRL